MMFCDVKRCSLFWWSRRRRTGGAGCCGVGHGVGSSLLRSSAGGSLADAAGPEVQESLNRRWGVHRCWGMDP